MTPDTQRTKSDPITIEQPGMRMTVAHRLGVGGSDEGLTFDIATAGPKEEGKRIFRFGCFYKNPHYHVGASGRTWVQNMKDEGVEDAPLDFGAAQESVSLNGQTSRIRRNRREHRPASDCRTAHPVRARNPR